jgi:hypothetical protein
MYFVVLILIVVCIFLKLLKQLKHIRLLGPYSGLSDTAYLVLLRDGHQVLR